MERLPGLLSWTGSCWVSHLYPGPIHFTQSNEGRYPNYVSFFGPTWPVEHVSVLTQLLSPMLGCLRRLGFRHGSSWRSRQLCSQDDQEDPK